MISKSDFEKIKTSSAIIDYDSKYLVSQMHQIGEEGETATNNSIKKLIKMQELYESLIKRRIRKAIINL